jgi:hypothetical protein
MRIAGSHHRARAEAVLGEIGGFERSDATYCGGIACGVVTVSLYAAVVGRDSISLFKLCILYLFRVSPEPLVKRSPAVPGGRARWGYHGHVNEDEDLGVDNSVGELELLLMDSCQLLVECTTIINEFTELRQCYGLGSSTCC